MDGHEDLVCSNENKENLELKFVNFLIDDTQLLSHKEMNLLSWNTLKLLYSHLGFGNIGPESSLRDEKNILIDTLLLRGITWSYLHLLGKSNVVFRNTELRQLQPIPASLDFLKKSSSEDEERPDEAYLEQSDDSDNDNEYNEKEFSVNSIKKQMHDKSAVQLTIRELLCLSVKTIEQLYLKLKSPITADDEKQFFINHLVTTIGIKMNDLNKKQKSIIRKTKHIIQKRLDDDTVKIQSVRGALVENGEMSSSEESSNDSVNRMKSTKTSDKLLTAVELSYLGLKHIREIYSDHSKSILNKENVRLGKQFLIDDLITNGISVKYLTLTQFKKLIKKMQKKEENWNERMKKCSYSVFNKIHLSFLKPSSLIKLLKYKQLGCTEKVGPTLIFYDNSGKVIQWGDMAESILKCDITWVELNAICPEYTVQLFQIHKQLQELTNCLFKSSSFSSSSVLSYDLLELLPTCLLKDLYILIGIGVRRGHRKYDLRFFDLDGSIMKDLRKEIIDQLLWVKLSRIELETYIEAIDIGLNSIFSELATADNHHTEKQAGSFFLELSEKQITDQDVSSDEDESDETETTCNENHCVDSSGSVLLTKPELTCLSLKQLKKLRKKSKIPNEGNVEQNTYHLINHLLANGVSTKYLSDKLKKKIEKNVEKGN